VNAQVVFDTHRLLDIVPNLAAPLEIVEPQIFAWASSLGAGAVYTRDQFTRHAETARLVGDLAVDKEVCRQRQMDFRLAAGTLTSLDRRPANGWDDYLELWTAQRLTHRLKVYEKSDFTRLRELEIRIGGILLNNQSMPLVLILPQPTGSYIQLGFETMVELDTSPFASNRRQARVLREHLLPLDERTMVAPAV